MAVEKSTAMFFQGLKEYLQCQFVGFIAASIIQTSMIGKEVGVNRKEKGSISISLA